MDTTLLYEHLCQVKPVTHAQLLAALNATVRELCALYGEKYVLRDGALRPITRVGQSPCIAEDYEGAVLDNLLYHATGEERYKTDFLAHAQYAYHNLWRGRSAGRRIRREVW